MPVSALTTIVRNFKHLNRRPKKPTRCCVKIAGPGERILMPAAMSNPKGNNNGATRRMQKRSSARFVARTVLVADWPRKVGRFSAPGQFQADEVVFEVMGSDAMSIERRCYVGETPSLVQSRIISLHRSKTCPTWAALVTQSNHDNQNCCARQSVQSSALVWRSWCSIRYELFPYSLAHPISWKALLFLTAASSRCQCGH